MADDIETTDWAHYPPKKELTVGDVLADPYHSVILSLQTQNRMAGKILFDQAQIDALASAISGALEAEVIRLLGDERFLAQLAELLDAMKEKHRDDPS